MVAVRKEKEPDKNSYVADIICPFCNEKMIRPCVSEVKVDRYDRHLRDFYGWCFDCNTGYAALQFKTTDGKWLTFRYRRYITDVNGENARTAGKWQDLYPLPDPAEVVTGPGGDYTKSHHIDTESEGVLKEACKVLRATSESLMRLMEVITGSGK